MSDETKLNEAEENTEEQSAAEAQTERGSPALEESPAESARAEPKRLRACA